MVRFDVNKQDGKLIDKIVKRIGEDLKVPRRDLLILEMDIKAVHLNGCELDLNKLLNASRFDFAHDVFGISNHLNREFGKLEGGFLPRCAEHD